MTEKKTLNVTINGTGFAADYTARTYGMIPHKNGVTINLAGVTSGNVANAERFAEQHGVDKAYANHAEMLSAVRPDIDNVASANFTHGPYTLEAAQAGVKVIVLEKPPVVWPGYPEGRQASAAVRRQESLDYLAEVLAEVKKQGSKLLYAEDFVYVDGVKGIVELLGEAIPRGQGKLIYQRGVCAHQGSHAIAYDTPSKSGGGSLFNKACHPLGPILYLKQVEGILRDGRPIRPKKVSAVALQILKHQPQASGEHFRVMQNVDDFGRITVIFDDETVAEVIGHDLSISGIRNELSIIADCAQYDVRINPNNENELFLPQGDVAGNLLFREKLPTPQGTSFPRPRQFYAHGYVGEMEDAVDCALDESRWPQSGALMAWDTMVVLMAGYESHEADAQMIDVSADIARFEVDEAQLPDPRKFGAVFQRV